MLTSKHDLDAYDNAQECITSFQEWVYQMKTQSDSVNYWHIVLDPMLINNSNIKIIVQLRLNLNTSFYDFLKRSLKINPLDLKSIFLHDPRPRK